MQVLAKEGVRRLLPAPRLGRESIGSEDGEFGHGSWGKSDHLFLFCGGFHNQGHAEILFQQMFAGSEAGGGLDIIGQAGHTKDEGVSGLLGAESGAGDYPALAERARQAQQAGKRAYIVLLLRRKHGKRSVLGVRFGSAMVANGESEQFPLFVAPPRRNSETTQEFAGGFLRRLFGMRVTDAVQSGCSQ